MMELCVKFHVPPGLGHLLGMAVLAVMLLECIRSTIGLSGVPNGQSDTNSHKVSCRAGLVAYENTRESITNDANQWHQIISVSAVSRL